MKTDIPIPVAGQAKVVHPMAFSIGCIASDIMNVRIKESFPIKCAEKFDWALKADFDMFGGHALVDEQEQISDLHSVGDCF